ncbi:hypothetical protein [Chryseobacterium sediminis]|uniref:hypothetical protein n=1 Tax=Chryseobacterium sediminis TaxID=1679494 RepID=UPI00286168CC|nr:hypothetical protein [Chryseobacterium sediminis]MDR6466033.1 hypothetical protein [Chryseobacterium sediminis]
MTEIQKIFSSFMYWGEAFAALTSLIYYNRVKKQHWKYLAVYLILIFLCESAVKWGEKPLRIDRINFHNYFVIPLQFIFFYWLYAKESLKKTKLFYILTGMYLLTYILRALFFPEKKVIFSFNYNIGCLLLMALVIMEYYKQVNSSEILNFSKNKMFYINLGVTLFYIANLPFMTFNSLLWKYIDIWDIYFIYFQVSGAVMYILFASSFIWGKQNS